MRVPAVFCLCLYLVCYIFKSFLILMVLKYVIYVLTWISLDMCEVGHIFTCLLAIRVSSSMNNPDIYFVHFFLL